MEHKKEKSHIELKSDKKIHRSFNIEKAKAAKMVNALRDRYYGAKKPSYVVEWKTLHDRAMSISSELDRLLNDLYSEQNEDCREDLKAEIKMLQDMHAKLAIQEAFENGMQKKNEMRRKI